MKRTLIVCFFLIVSFSSLAQEDNSENTSLLNIGFVSYTKTSTNGTLMARWNLANKYWGPGIAIGKSIANGFEGDYHVRYFYENGDFSDEYDLKIRRNGDFYDVTWIVDGKVAARGVGMELEESLAVGWRRTND